MKVFKDILAITLLVLTVFSYLGHDIVDYYGHVADRIENTASSKGSQGSVIHESSQEEDSHPILPKNNVQMKNSGCEPMGYFSLFFPSKLYYTIWLPPELS
jgi:hypothetical protein